MPQSIRQARRREGARAAARRPRLLAEALLRDVAGHDAMEVERGSVAWSNELGCM